MSQTGKALWRRALVILTIVLVAQIVLSPTASASGCPFFVLVRPGDTLSSLAFRFGTTVNAIAQANGIVNPNRIFAGQCLLIPCPTRVVCPQPCPPATGCIIVVRPGETLTGIAARFGTSVFTLMRLNGLVNPNLIFAGQRLRVC